MARGNKFLIGVLSAGAAAGVAVVGVVTLRNSGENTTIAGRRGEYSVCLKTDISFIESATKRCYAPDDAAALSRNRVVDDQGAPTVVRLSHPSDLARDLEPVETCERYRILTGEGWYAFSTREMRSEAYFERACGVLALIENARPADVSYFVDEALSDFDMASLVAGVRFRIEPQEEQSETGAGFSKSSDGVWLIDSGDQVARLQEIAHADFDFDGRGDMLVFVSISVKDGTATASRVGLVDKPSASGPVKFVE